MSLSRKRQNGNESDESLLGIKRQAFGYKPIARLYNTTPGQQHMSIPRKTEDVLIGRSSTCDVRINGNDVSSKHCKLTLTINNNREYLCIKDLSSNGTYLNDEIIGKDCSILLRSGDKLDFAKTGGSYIFRYIIDIKNTKVQQSKSFFDDYILGEQLGSGHYAVVKEATDRSTGDVVAVKIFHPNKTNSQGNENDDVKLQQEMSLLLSINHPNIVRFISHYVEPINQYSVTSYLVLEKMNNGELFQRIINKLKLRQDETRAIFKQLLSGLRYLHENSIIHRDIKPENILLDITPRTSKCQQQTGPWDEDEYDIKVKIADFGLAKFIGELKFTNTLCGTPAYVAPEILSNKRNYSTKVDLWLSGVLLYVCLCGFPPFSDELGPPNMREQILTGKYAFYSPYWDDINDSVLHLISSLLVVDPSERFDVIQTCEHYWFNEQDDTRDHLMIINNESVQRTPVRSNSLPLSLREKYNSEMMSEANQKSSIM